MRVIVDSLTLVMPVSARPISAMTPIDEDSWAAIRVFGQEPPPTTYILEISSTDGGTVITPGEGAFESQAGDTIPLEAAPIDGYNFVEWAGDIDTIANPNDAQTYITMYGDYSITAVFEPIGVDLGALRGHVYDKETGYPIEGVNIAFQLISDQTDAEGYYELGDIPVGTQTFTFFKAGYKLASRDADIIANKWTTLDVELTPGEGPEPERPFPWLWLGLGGAATAIGIVIAKKRKPD